MKSFRSVGVAAATATLLILAACSSTVDGAAVPGTTLAPTVDASSDSSLPVSSAGPSAPERPSAEPSVPPTTLPATTTRAGDTTGSTTSTASTGSTRSATTPTAPTSDAGTGTAGFGGTFTWGDGLVVTVGAPKAFKPSDTAAIRPAKAYEQFEITVTNRTGSVYDPSALQVGAQSGGKESEQVFDSENGIGGSPSTTVLDGRKIIFAVGFGVEDPKDIIVDVQPGYDYEPGLFSSDATGNASSDSRPTEAPPEPNLSRYAKPFAWEDGLQVVLSAPVPYTPSNDGYVQKAPAYVVTTVTLTNKTGKTFDPSSFLLSAQSGGREADRIFDYDGGLDSPPSSPLPNGRSITFKAGFGVQDAKDVVIEVRPDFDHEAVIFTSN